MTNHRNGAVLAPYDRNERNRKARGRHGAAKRYAARRMIRPRTICFAVAALALLIGFLVWWNPAAHTPIRPIRSAEWSGGNLSTARPQPSAADGSARNASAVRQPADVAEWSLILVNPWNPVPENYTLELTELANGKSVDRRIYPALQAMFDTARRNGVYPVVSSGYRTEQRQRTLFMGKVADYQAEGYAPEDAAEKAKTWVAVPGTSEHQLGIAVDINADGVHSAGYEVYDWLEKNAHTFGFIRRYPPDKTEITGIMDEPWHYRYVGVKAAADIFEQGVCLEEYLNAGRRGETTP